MSGGTLISSLLIAVTLLTAGSCGEAGSEDREPPDEESSADPTPGSFSRDGVHLSWEFLETEVHFTLSAPTGGWVAVGFEPSSAMLDADIVIGCVSDGEIFISDQWGNGYTSHRPDTALGGSDDVTLISGSENGGITEISFSRPLSTGDDFDHQLRPGGAHTVLLAYGPDDADGFAGKHSWVKIVDMTLD